MLKSISRPIDSWIRVRNLAKELSVALAECEGATWSAQILPNGSDNAISFIAVPQENESLSDKAERLGYELSLTLVDYLEGRFYAAIAPAQPGGVLPVAFISRSRMPADAPYVALQSDAFASMTADELAFYHLKQAARAMKKANDGEPVHFAIAEDYKSASICVVERSREAL